MGAARDHRQLDHRQGRRQGDLLELLTRGASLAFTPDLLRAFQQSGGKLIQRAIPSSGERLPVVGLHFGNPAPPDHAAIKEVLETLIDDGGRFVDTVHGNSPTEEVTPTIAPSWGFTTGSSGGRLRERMAELVDSWPLAGTTGPRASQGAVVVVPAAILDRYAGEYKMASGIVTVRRVGSALHVKLGNTGGRALRRAVRDSLL